MIYSHFKHSTLENISRYIFLLCFILMLSFNSHAQQKSIDIKGKIIDESGMAMPGVNITEKGTTNGSSSDIDGHFTLRINNTNATLLVSFMGYETEEILVGDNRDLQISMTPDLAKLDEVIVVGYGTQKKANLTGAVSSFDTDDIKSAKVANMSNALVGSAPGLIIEQGSGEPGKDGSNIYIRGVTTYQGNTTPAIIIDGIERAMSDFNNLDPNEIESVNVLKDAASAAIFGMRGANGVIVITTKRGKQGRPKLSYSYNISSQSPTRLPEFVESYEYGQIINERNSYIGQTPAYTEEELTLFRTGTSPDYYPNVDWYDVVMENKSVLQQQHNLKLSGGSQKAKYFASLGYLDQDGFYDELNYKRYNVRTNLDLSVAEYTKIAVDFNAVYDVTDEPGSSSGAIFTETLRSLPIMAARYSNGKLAAPLGGYAQPLAMIEESGYQDTENTTVQGRFELEQGIPWVKGLKVQGILSYGKNFYHQKAWNTQPQFYQIQADGTFLALDKAGPTLSLVQNGTDFQELQARLSYETTIGDHNLSALAMALSKKDKQKYSTINAWGYENEALEQVSAAPENNSTGIEYNYGRVSYIGRINYNYKQKYLLEANVRRDGTENFAPDYRWGTFSAYSAAWIISEEEFFKSNIPQIDFLKIRASYGTLGNDQINGGRFPYYDKYELYTAGEYLGSALNYGDYVFDNAYVKGFQPGAIGNPVVTWETSTKSNIGLDARILNKVSLSFDYFTEIRSDILTQRSASLPDHFGATLPMENIGEVKNSGVEIAMGYTQQFNKVRVFLNGNMTFTQNEIINMDEAVGTNPELKREGRPVDAYYGYIAEGIFNSEAEIEAAPLHQIAGLDYNTLPGDVRYKDINDDGVINADDRTYLGEGWIPNFTYGLSGGMEYAGFDLNFLIQGASDVNMNLQSQVVWPLYNGGGVPQFWADNHWTPNNTDATYSSINPTQNNFPTSATSSLYVYDASYVRLKNIELGYSLPKHVLSKVKMDGIRVYVSGRNLITISDIPQVDPEADSSSGNNYPNLKSVNFGVTLDF